MNTLITITCLSTLFSAFSSGQIIQGAPGANSAPLDREVPHYELTDGSLIDGLAELSQSPSAQLHLGIEEILRERLRSPRDRSVRFSLLLEHKSVRDILNALCDWDARYAWSMDGASVNVYPRARADDQTDLLNFRVERIQLSDIPDPDQALTPLSKLFPGEQVGYMQMGGDNTYDAPWTVAFENLTVRQFMNGRMQRNGSRQFAT